MVVTNCDTGDKIMKIKLNDRAVKALKPSDKRYFVQIEGYPGLQLRVNKNGEVSFIYRYTIQGRRRVMTLGSYPKMTIKIAGVRYADAARQVEMGVDPMATREEARDETNPIIADFADRYLKHYIKPKLKASTGKEYERLINKYILPKWKKRKIKDIKRVNIVALVEKMAVKTPIQANRTLAVIKGMFSYAVRVGVLEHSPATGVSPPGKETVKDRVLSLNEIATMIKALEQAPRDARDILLLILLTGQRPGEVSAIRRKQVDEDWWILSVKENKSGQPHRVYLASWARQIIRDRIDDLHPSDYLFPTHGRKRKHILADNMKNWLHRRLGKQLKEAGVEYFTAHDLRRSAATGMAMLGHAAVVPDILNHAPQGITRTVYDRYDRAPEIKRALIAWETAIRQALAGGGRKVVEVDFQ